jgi:tRNA G26 N,N-dimethylase Trm1
MALTDRGVIVVSATDGVPLCGAAGESNSAQLANHGWIPFVAAVTGEVERRIPLIEPEGTHAARHALRERSYG